MSNIQSCLQTSVGHHYYMYMIISMIIMSHLQGSGAFVYGWAFFGDRFSNGIVNNIILRIHHSM